MELLVCVINDEDKLEQVLSGFLDLGVTGATAIRSQGMGKVLGEIPVLAGLQTLRTRGRPDNTTVFSIIDDPERMNAAIKLVQRICGDLEQPSTGILFTIPVSRVVGLAPEIQGRKTEDTGT